MCFDVLTDPRYLVSVFLLAWLLVSCAGEETGRDCREVQQEITTFTEKNILPLVDIESSPKIERSTVIQLKRLRTQVLTCALPDAPNSATEWNEDNFVRLYAWLGFIEVTLELAAEEDNPETTRMLINSPSFGETVLDIQAALGLQTGSNPALH